MSSAATNDAGLLQPDYSAKPVTFLKDVILKAISFVDTAANGHKWLLCKSEDGMGGELGTATALIKAYDPAASDNWEVAYTVMAEVGVVDLQRDVWTEDEIRKAAHQFLADGGLLTHQHLDMNSVGQLAESYVTLVDMEIPTPDGKSTLVKKGSWLIGVKPNAEMKKKIMAGEITGMSVQGSAQRVTADEEAVKAFIEKADKDNRAIPRKAGGEGIKLAQHLLGTEESGEYDDATEAALMAWMDKKGVPGLPTLATLKFLLSDQPVAAPAQAAPAAGPAVEQLAPLDMVEPPREEAEKDSEPYNPATTSNASDSNVFQHNGANEGAQPGSMGLRVQDLTPDSPADDLKAALYQSVQEGNEALTAYLQEHAGGASSGDLYGTDLSQPELWFMYSKFVGGARPMIDAAGDLVTGQQVEKEVEPEVEKGAWTGSHGGHDPDAHNGNAYNFVRTFGEWAHGKQSVAAKKLLDNGVVKTPEAADRLAAWLKDQWMNSTKWRHGSVKKNDDFTQILKDMDAKPELLEALHAEDEESTAPNPVTKVTEILRAGGSADHIMGQINEALSNRPTGMDGAAPALKNAILQALEAPEDERDEMIDNIIEDFTRYAKHSALTKSDSFSKATAAEETNANPNNSPIGEEMDRAKIEENRDHLTAAAEFITSILDGQSHEVPAEVEKEVDEAEKPVVEDAPEAPEAKDDEVAEAPDDLEAAAEEALEDEDEDVTEEELLRVLNHVVETMDSLEDRVAQLESLEKKLDQVGELAKALDVTGQIDVLNTQVSELTKALDAAVSSEEMEVVRKQLDDIASTPGAPSALPVDEARVAQPVVQEVAKSAPAQNNLWVGTFR